MGISRNLSNLAEGASTTGVLGTSKGGTGLSAVGTNGQVLSSNGTSLAWTTPASGSVTNIATGTGLTGGPITTTGTISLLTASTTQLGGVKVDGTTVTINGSGVISATSGTTGVSSVATGIGLTGGPITTTGTISLLTASTTQLGGVKVDGTTIAVNGSNQIYATNTGVLTTANWNTVGAGSTTTLASGGRYYASAGSTVTLPASPAAGNQVTISVGNYVNVTIGNNGQNIMGFAQPMTIDIANVSVTLEYINSTQGWVVY